MISAFIGSWRLLSPRRRIALSLFALSNFIVSSLDVLAVSLVGVIGALALGGTIRVPFISFSPSDSELAIYLLLVIATAVFLTKTILGVLIARQQFNFLARVETAFSNQIAAHVLGRGLSFFQRYSRSDLEWSILRSTDIAFSKIVGRVLILVAEVGLAVLIFGLFIYADWLSAILILIYFSFVLGLLQLFANSASKSSGSDVAEGSVAVGQAISDSIVAFREISVLHRLPFFLNKISESRYRVAKGNATHFYLQSVPRLLLELSLIVGAIGFVGLNSLRNDGALDFGLLSIFIFGSLRMMSALLPIQRAFTELRFFSPQAISAQEIILDALSSGQREQHSEGHARLTGQPAERIPLGPIGVSIEDLHFAYTDRENVIPTLSGINLRIHPGENIALIGPSGAGKSTLIDLILGLLEPASGHLYFNGTKPRDFIAANPGAIGYVPQKPGLVSGTILENVALGQNPDEVDHEAVSDALRDAQILEFVSGLPEGVNSWLGNHVDSLSGGQIQRIGLARALYTRPRLLVLDEATSALDAELEASIGSSMQQLRGLTTILTVAHRLSTIQEADNVILMVGGEIIGQGEFSELRKSSPIVKKYVSLMSFR